MSIENWIGTPIIVGVFLGIFATMVCVGGWSMAFKTWLTPTVVVAMVLLGAEMASAGGMA